jgi:hypothetical protein
MIQLHCRVRTKLAGITMPNIVALKKIFLFFVLACISMPAMATVSYVSAAATGSNNGTAWANAYTTLSAALNAANTNAAIDTILVAEGTYYPTGAQNGTARDSAFIIYRGGLKLYGGYNAATGARDINTYVTYLDGNINSTVTDTDNSYHIMVIAGLAATADSVVIDGFTIRNGYANGTGEGTYNGQTLLQNDGAGLFLANDDNGAYTAIRNCTFSVNNEVQVTNTLFGLFGDTQGGAGIYNNSSSPFIYNCLFSQNDAIVGSGNGGAIYNRLSSPIITNCIFLENLSNWGGAIYDTASSVLFTNCTFSRNLAISGYNFTAAYADGMGGAIYESTGSSSTISSCLFAGNTASAGGGAIISGDEGFSTSTLTVSHCVFINDTASYGGAIRMESGTSLKSFDNIFYQNVSDTGGGGAMKLTTSGIDSIYDNVFAQNKDITAGGSSGGAIRVSQGTTYIASNTFLCQCLCKRNGRGH